MQLLQLHKVRCSSKAVRDIGQQQRTRETRHLSVYRQLQHRMGALEVCRNGRRNSQLRLLLLLHFLLLLLLIYIIKEHMLALQQLCRLQLIVPSS